MSPKRIRRILRILRMLGPMTMGLFLLGLATPAAAIQLERVSSPIFYIDDAHGDAYRGMYAAYRVTNDDPVAYPNLWVRINGFVPGATVTLAPTEDGLATTGPLGVGASRVVYFYLVASGPKTFPESHTVSVLTSRTGPPLAASSFPLTVSSTITANANKVFSVAYSPLAPVLGGRLEMTITGETGTIGGARNFAYTPASRIDWPANSYELVGTTLLLGAEAPITNRLHIQAASSANQPYTITYVFRVVCAASGTQISMLNHIDSGANNKHNDPELLPVAPVPPPDASPLLLSRAPTTASTAGGELTHTLTVVNTSTQTVAFDDLFDRIESPVFPATYVPGSTTLDGTPFADPMQEGSTLHWSSSFPLAPNEGMSLTYRVLYPARDAVVLHAAYGEVSSSELGLTCGDGVPTRIDTTPSLNDDAPATARITVATLHAQDDDASAAESVPLPILVGALTANDGGIDPTSFALLSATTDAHGTVSYNPVTGLVTYLSAISPPPEDAFRYRVCNVIDATRCETATVHVRVNRRPVVSNAEVYNVPSAVSTLDLDTVFSDPDGDRLGTARVLASPGGETAIAAHVLAFAPLVPDAAGTWVVTFELCDDGVPTACATGTALIVHNDPPVLASFTVTARTNLLLAEARVGRITLAELLISLGTVAADDPTDGDSDGLGSVRVAPASTGPWSLVASLNGGSFCAVTPSLDIEFTAGRDLGATPDAICWVEVCEELPEGRACTTTRIEALVDRCLEARDCAPDEVCAPNRTCVPCWDSATYPWIDEGCFPERPICDDHTCVSCQDTVADPRQGADLGCNSASPVCDVTDPDGPRCVACTTGSDCPDGVCDPVAHVCVTCRDTAPPGAIDAGCDAILNACDTTQCVDCQSNPDCAAGDVCDIPRRTCVDCLPTANPDDVDPGCDASHPECVAGPTGDRCVACVDDTDCDGVCFEERCYPRDQVDARDDLYVTTVATALRINAAAGLLDNDLVPLGALPSVSLVHATAPDPTTEGTLLLEPSGAFTFVPFATFVGTVAFDYELQTVLGGHDRATCRIIVNGPPVARDDLATTPEDTPIDVRVTANDTDPNGDTLTVSRVLTPPAHGTATPIGQSLRYAPAPNWSGHDRLVYEVCDPHHACASAALTLTVTPVNDPPIGGDDVAETAEDIPLLIAALLNDRDPYDPTTLHIARIARAPALGQVEIVDDTLRYAPAPDRAGVDTFAYGLCDGEGGCVDVDVRVEVHPNNDAPIAHDDTAVTPARTEVTVAVLDNDADPDGDPLTLTRVMIHPTSGEAELRPDGTLAYRPGPFVGTDRLVYEVCDAHLCAAGAVTFFVGLNNRAPRATDDLATTRPATPVQIHVLDNDVDPDGPTPTLRDFTAPAHGRVTAVANTLTYVPDPAFSGLDPFTYTTCDAYNACDSARVTVSVSPRPNAPPVAVDDRVIALAAPQTFAPLDNDVDPDGDALRVLSVTAPAHGAAFTALDRVTYTPAPGFLGEDTFAVTVTDLHGGLATSLVRVLVRLTADPAPLARDDRYDADPDMALILPLLDNDEDLEQRPLSIFSVASTLDVNLVHESLGVITPTDPPREDHLVYTVTHPEGGQAAATVTLAYPAPPILPVALADTVTTDEDVAVLIAVTVNDYDPKAGGLDVTDLTAPRHGEATLGPDDAVLYRPDPDFVGPDTFTYTLCDELGGCVEGGVTVLVRPVDEPPVAHDDLATTHAAVAVSIPVLVNDLDPDGDLLTLDRVTTPPAHGVLDLVDDLAIYLPAPGFRGLDRFRYAACDPAEHCAEALVTIAVDLGNAAPLARDDQATTTGPVRIPVLDNDADPDLDPLTLTAVTDPRHGTARLDGLAIIYHPDADFAGADAFAYTVCDDAEACTAARVSVTVTTSGNLAPIAIDDFATTIGGVAVAIPVLANDLDPDLDPLRIWSLGRPAHGTVAARPDGTLEYTPEPGHLGEDRFEVVIADPAGALSASTTRIEVLSRKNLPPVAVDDAAPALPLVPTRVDVLDNDSDPDGDPLAISAITQPAAGTVSLALGALIYKPGPDLPMGNPPIDTFTYTVTDRRGAFATARVAITFPRRNHPPRAVDDVGFVNEDGGLLIAVTGNDVDPDGDPLTLTVHAASHGAVTRTNDGVVLYRGDPDFHGVDAFTYTICDPDGACADADVGLVVMPTNDPPQAAPDAVATAANTPIVIAVLDNDGDPDGDPLTLTRLTLAPRLGLAYLENRTIVYSPPPGASDETFAYEVCDPSGACDRASVRVIAGGDDRAPIARDDFAITDAGVPVDVLPLENDDDPDGDPLFLADIAPSACCTIAQDGDRLTLTPALDLRGDFALAVTVCDARGLCATSQLQLTVEAPSPTDSTGPLALDDLATTGRDTVSFIDVLDNDLSPNGDPLTLVSTSLPAHGLAHVEGDAVRFVPERGFVGATTFTYVARNLSGLLASATVTVHVTAPANRAPVAQPDAAVIGAGDLILDVLANDFDPDGDPLRVVSATLPPDGILKIEDSLRALRYTPGTGGTFDYTVTDGFGGLASARVTLTRPTPNRAPIGTDDLVTTDEDLAVLFDALQNDVDPDDDTLTITRLVAPSHGEATLESTSDKPLIRYTPRPDFFGDDLLVYEVCDPHHLCDLLEVHVVVEPTPDAPIARDDATTVNAGKRVEVDALANDDDADGDSLTLTRLVLMPAHGTAASTRAGVVTYTPDHDLVGADHLVYEVCDPTSRCATATITFEVATARDAPLAQDDRATTREGVPVELQVLDNDVDPNGDPLTIGLIGQPRHGTLTRSNRALRYTPDVDFAGVDTAFYEACDPTNLCTAARVTLTVEPGPNSLPIAIDDVAVTALDTPVVIDVLDNDFDPDGDPLTVTSVSDGTHGSAAIDREGRVVYTPRPSFVGPDFLTVQIADSHGAPAASRIFVTTEPAPNHAPIATDDRFEITTKGPRTLPVLDNDRDPDGDPLTLVAILALPPASSGTFTLTSDGLTFTPSGHAPSTVTFRYRVSDGRAEAEATVTLTHRFDNLPPIALDEVLTTPEDTPILIRVLVNDRDPEGSPLSVASLFTPDHGTVVPAADGAVVFSPARDYVGLDTFAYTVCDARDACAMAHVDVTITPIPDAPIAADDGVVTDVDQSVGIDALENDLDPDGDPLRLVDVSLAPSHGYAELLLTRAGSTLRYVPDPGVSGVVDAFVYDVCDPDLNCDSGLVFVAIGTGNQAPVVNHDAATVAHGGVLSLDVLGNDLDPDGEPLTLTAIGHATLGTLTSDGQRLTYVASPTALGVDTFTYTACDPRMACETATVAVTVVDGDNRPPIATDDIASTAPRTAVTLAVLDNDHDPDGDALRVLSFEAPSHGQATVDASGHLTYRPVADFVGTEHFEVLITDGRGGVDHSMIKILVSRPNHAPLAVDDVFARRVDLAGLTILDVRRNDLDPDGDSLELVSVSQPAGGSTQINGTAIWLLTAPDMLQDQVFHYGVSDGRGGFDEATVRVTAPTRNGMPDITDDFAVLPEDHAALFDVLENDRDPEGLALAVTRVTAQPTQGEVTLLGDRSLLYVARPDRVGSDVFAYEACDERGGCAEGRVRLEITPTLDPPVAEDDAYALRAAIPYRLPILRNDVDLDTRPDDEGRVNAGQIQFPHVVITRAPVFGSAAVVDEDIVFIGDPDHPGHDSLQYRVCDLDGLCDEAQVDLLIGSKNRNPLALPDDFETRDHDPIELDVLADDLDRDGDLLHLDSVGPSQHGETAILDDVILYVPDPGFVGRDDFPYTACDPHGACASAWVHLDVDPGRHAPVALDDVGTTRPGKSVVLDLLANDLDPDHPAARNAPTDLTALTGAANSTDPSDLTDAANATDPTDPNSLRVLDFDRPAHGTARVDRYGRLSYLPRGDFLGTERFDVRIANASGLTSVSTCVIHVLDRTNLSPVAEDDLFLVPEGRSKLLEVRNNDGDPDGDPTRLVVAVSPHHGKVRFSADDQVIYHPAPHYVGEDRFTYAIVDPWGAYAEATVVVIVGDRDRDTLSDRTEANLGTDPDDPDTDDDGLNDALEVATLDPLAYDLAIDTDPRDADTDDDGLSDGSEVSDTDPLDPDSDDDGLPDGLELGVTDLVAAGTSHGGFDFAGTDPTRFAPDLDPGTVTDPNDDDSDDDGLSDGREDLDRNGRWEGVIGATGTAGSGETDPLAFDTDGDDLSDGLERGLASPEATQTDPSVFRGDGDPTTTTDPLDTDTDDGSRPDGEEDEDHDGRFEPERLGDNGRPLETNPNLGFDDREMIATGGPGCAANGSGGLPARELADLVFLVLTFGGLGVMAIRRRDPPE